MVAIGGSATACSPRVVYFISSHVHPPQVERLVRACLTGSPHSRVLVHHDYDVADLDPQRFAGLANVDILPAQEPVGWGAFNMCAAVIRCMSWLRENHAFDWVVCLSGQDYPIRPLAEIERELGQSGRDGYLRASPVEETPWREGPERYLYSYRELPRLPGWRPIRGRIQRHGSRRLAQGRHPLLWSYQKDRFRIGLRRNPFGRELRCYKGSSWWTLSRKAIDYMLDEAARRPDLVAHYRRVGFAPNESFFQTLLCNNRDLDLVTDDNLRFICWAQPNTGHPVLLTSREAPEFLASGKHFARKLDERADPQVLDIIDAAIGLSDPAPAMPVVKG